MSLTIQYELTVRDIVQLDVDSSNGSLGWPGPTTYVYAFLLAALGVWLTAWLPAKQIPLILRAGFVLEEDYFVILAPILGLAMIGLSWILISGRYRETMLKNAGRRVRGDDSAPRSMDEVVWKGSLAVEKSGLRWTSDSGEVFWAWATIGRVESRHDFYFVLRVDDAKVNVWTYIPTRAFSSSAERHEFETAVASSLDSTQVSSGRTGPRRRRRFTRVPQWRDFGPPL